MREGPLVMKGKGKRKWHEKGRDDELLGTPEEEAVVLWGGKVSMNCNGWAGSVE